MSRTSPAERFRQRISSGLTVDPGAAILVGVSGGVDSTVLLHVLVALGYRCRVLHIDHGLRPEAADVEAAEVQEGCRKLAVPCEVVQIDVRGRAARQKESVQMAARHLRLAAFKQCAVSHGIGYVAVGHNQDDQAETLILNLTRGTGPEGIAGMRIVRLLTPEVTLVRPLLGESRESIAAYAKDTGLIWREDASNWDESFDRARLRQRVMPHLDARALVRSASMMRDWVDEVLRPLVVREFTIAAGDRSLSADLLAEQPPVMARRLILEALQRWLPKVALTHDLAERILQLTGGQAGRRVQTGGGVIWRGRRELIFSDEADRGDDYGGYLSLDQSLDLPQGRLSVQVTSERPVSLRHLTDTWVDADRIELPLRVRPWHFGDRIRPLGLSGKKKVSDILTDRAVPVHRRSEQMVVCSGTEIVWVIGHCISEDFKVTAGTRSFMRLRLDTPGRDLVLFRDAAEIHARVRELGQTLSADYHGKRPLMVVLLRGAFVFAADLIRAMDIPVEVDFWGLSSYEDALESSGEVNEVWPLRCEVTGRHVIVVEDIVDSGRTLCQVRHQLNRWDTASVAVVTLLRARSSKVSVDYAGFTTEPYFVVGYGLDAAQQHRNLPDLYYLKPTA